ncbi:MAG TPA: hypothetical protein DCZ72_10970, partial [Armatimonadetes bacterium]|nr:hypothetical protein [Armatimonadota bacterium]
GVNPDCGQSHFITNTVPYMKSAGLWYCPSTSPGGWCPPGPGDNHTSYGFNQQFNGSLARMRVPAECWLVCETGKDCHAAESMWWDMGGHLPQPHADWGNPWPEGVHSGGRNYLWGDGHVKWVSEQVARDNHERWGRGPDTQVWWHP